MEAAINYHVALPECVSIRDEGALCSQPEFVNYLLNRYVIDDNIDYIDNEVRILKQKASSSTVFAQ